MKIFIKDRLEVIMAARNEKTEKGKEEWKLQVESKRKIFKQNLKRKEKKLQTELEGNKSLLQAET